MQGSTVVQFISPSYTVYISEKVYYHVFNVCPRKHLSNAMEVVCHSNSLLCIVCLLVAKVQRGPWQVFRGLFAVGWATGSELAGLRSLSLDFSRTYSGQKHLVHVVGACVSHCLMSQCVCVSICFPSRQYTTSKSFLFSCTDQFWGYFVSITRLLLSD